MIVAKKIKPMFTALITTMNRYETDNFTKSGIIDASKQKGALKEYQEVISIGSSVRDVKVGDIVSINPARFAVMKHKEGSFKDGVIQDNQVLEYKFDIIKIDNEDYLLLQDRDIEFIIEEYEIIEDAPAPTVIQPPKPSILI